MCKLNLPNKKVEIVINNFLNLKIEAVPIKFRDLAYTRRIKNANSTNFFFNKHITWPRHFAWWLKYKKQTNNYFYVIKLNGNNYGTFAIKFMENEWHIYSVIRDAKVQYEPLAMKESVLFMLNFFANFGEIYASVLSSNKALQWYYCLGFEEVEKFKQFTTIRFNSKKD
jgi:hypothetical protein